MEQRISLVTLGVADLGESAAFYERLGWRRSSAGNEEIVFFDAGGIVLALFARAALADDAGVSPDGGGFAGVAVAHNVRVREEVDTVLAEAVAAGASLVKPATAVHWGGYSGYFADPDGHLWEVAWNPFFPLDVDGLVRLPAS